MIDSKKDRLTLDRVDLIDRDNFVTPIITKNPYHGLVYFEKNKKIYYNIIRKLRK